MRIHAAFAAILLGGAATAYGDGAPPFDAAAAFGARPSVAGLRLSPDGNSVAYIVPGPGQGSAVRTLSLAPGAKARVAIVSDGKPDRITGCNWVSNERLVCVIYEVIGLSGKSDLVPVTRLIALNADGSNPRVLSKRSSLYYSRGAELGGGRILDWLPDQDGSVLMSRVTLPDDHVGSRIGTSDRGVGVDVVDTRTLESKEAVPPNEKAVNYISDGRGAVRIMGLRGVRGATGQDSGSVTYLYKRVGEPGWQTLGSYNFVTRDGFEPVAVDHDTNVAYGFKKHEGRMALYTVALDGSLRETLVYARDDVDVDDVIRIGRRGRVVGVSYATDYRAGYYLDPAIERLAASLAKALPGHPGVRIVDSSVDESKLLVFASRDDDAGVYYLFDRTSHQLQTFLVVRDALENVKLATVKPVSYAAADGTAVPGYLTLPPGQTEAKGLPAIVLPHGGPSARDEWGFDWLPQFYAARGYAVLQPNYRGSAGYGDAWFRSNGYRSWPTAIGDVLDAGRWLVAQGIADPAKLAIVGWSYGGYAALQAAATDASVYKAVIAIAPVTDLPTLAEQYRHWSNFDLAQDFIGEGPHLRDGSPAQNAAKIKVPVLLFHGTNDLNVAYLHSQLMDRALTAAGTKHELVTFPDLDHQLEDSAARTDMLRRSDTFLRQVLGL